MVVHNLNNIFLLNVCTIVVFLLNICTGHCCMPQLCCSDLVVVHGVAVKQYKRKDSLKLRLELVVRFCETFKC